MKVKSFDELYVQSVALKYLHGVYDKPVRSPRRTQWNDGGVLSL
jgi:hypothetical protein